MKEICKWYKTAQCGASFCGGGEHGERECRWRRHMGLKGAYSGISEQTVQHKATRLTGIKWPRREKGGKE